MTSRSSWHRSRDFTHDSRSQTGDREQLTVHGGDRDRLHDSHRLSSTDEPESPSTETTFDEHVRTEVLEILADGPSPMTIDELVDHFVDGRETETEDGLVAWSAVHERLYYVDLPRLNAAGALDFDPNQGLVDGPSAESGRQ
ncbi:DUF7344 domain-containing protein [Natronoglomus mannanivorans]|uniref:DUF7344 domain-containing protein n=1 Tax=Natronoglomus mannanivorans TaxID=2979990 RepID=A0AAP2YZX7_9EURY|nr:hypothetical protein [Halobacteria archaeon AArc-xg1-1]